MEEKCKAILKLANIFGNSMILQRDRAIKLWGRANHKERVKLTIGDRFYETISDDKGRWSVIIEAMQAGGPYSIQISTAYASLIVEDVYFGEVWLCAGQSNMELPIARVMEKYHKEIDSYENTLIRAFRVEMTYDYNVEKTEIPKGNWYSINQNDTQRFSAVGYFFAKALYEKYQVPIGLIDTSVGGSKVESWLSEKELREYPDVMEILKDYQNTEKFNKMMQENELEISKWYTELEAKDKGLQGKNPWHSVEYQPKKWLTSHIPGKWEEQGIHIMAGVVWFKKEIELDREQIGKKTKIFLGTLRDSDRTYINGIEIGRTEYQYPPRIYNVPDGVLKEGKNVITIRAITNTYGGQFTLDKFYGLEIGEERLDLSGEWLYKIGAEVKPIPTQIFLPMIPLGLYNGMIHPIIDTEIKGVIWYQGESNTDNSCIYKERFTTLIKTWRRLWRNENLPFIYAQLTSFGELTKEPQESSWAEIREAQLQALELPHTAMAVITDIGEWNDLHPLNKKDVGNRLALAAQVLAYGEKKVYSGPIAKSAQIKENKIVISFEQIGSGLTIKKGTILKEFAISEDGKHFIWADAEIRDNKVIVWNETIKKPIAVRYAWADSPIDANLSNKEGLMASPFRLECQ